MNEVKFVGIGVVVVLGKIDDNICIIMVDVVKGELVNVMIDVLIGNVVNVNCGKVMVKNGDVDKVVIVKNVVDVINSVGIVIKVVNEYDMVIIDNDEIKNDVGEVVKVGDVVIYIVGKNLCVKCDVYNFIFVLVNDIMVNSVNVSMKLIIGNINLVGLISDVKGLYLFIIEGININVFVYLNGIKFML